VKQSRLEPVPHPDPRETPSGASEAASGELFRAKGGSCRACCKACGEHFSGTSAFDRHRHGSHLEGTRYCEYPLDVKDKDGVPQLVAKTETGHCDLSGGERVTGVVIWQLRASAERDRERAA
jgi:hypothetical protein